MTEEFKKKADSAARYAARLASHCYEIARAENKSEWFCRRMFSIGTNAVAGRVFCPETASAESIATISAEMLDNLVPGAKGTTTAIHAILGHQTKLPPDPKEVSDELRILIEAELSTVEYTDALVPACEKLAAILCQYGSNSREYRTAEWNLATLKRWRDNDHE